MSQKHLDAPSSISAIGILRLHELIRFAHHLAPLRMTTSQIQLMLSTTIAIPCPPPMHADASPYFFFRRRNS
jgi:hypothetical protein